MARRALTDLPDDKLAQRLIDAHKRCKARQQAKQPVKGSYLDRLKREMWRRHGFLGTCPWWEANVLPYI